MALHLMFLLLLTTAFLQIVDAQTCEYIEFGGDHTMCKYAAQSCKTTNRGVSEDDGKVLLHEHNEYRHQVAAGLKRSQPHSNNMKKLKWNDELAAIAQRWADQCIKDNDVNRQTKKYPMVGQNIYSAKLGTNKLNATLVVGAWFNEIVAFNPEHVKSFHSQPGTENYSQLVWGETSQVGCGFSSFNGELLVVCNYGPGGNVKGKPMYAIGSPCHGCTGPCSSTYPALCH